jgi:hypothetical protein
MRPASVVVSVASVLLLLGVAPAYAQQPRRGPDTSYGRFAGDLSIEAAAGAVLGGTKPRLGLDLRARYLSSGGVFASYEEGALLSSQAAPARLVATGLELRPLFLARWARGLHFGEARWDLTLDSLGVELGAVFQARTGGPFAAEPGGQAGVVFGVPLGASAAGPWVRIRSGLRLTPQGLAGASDLVGSPSHVYVAFEFAFQMVTQAGIVDAGDPAPR